MCIVTASCSGRSRRDDVRMRVRDSNLAHCCYCTLCLRVPRTQLRCGMSECLAWRGARVSCRVEIFTHIAASPCTITSACRDAADSSGDGGFASKQAARSQSCTEHMSRFVPPQAGQICILVYMATATQFADVWPDAGAFLVNLGVLAAMMSECWQRLPEKRPTMPSTTTRLAAAQQERRGMQEQQQQQQNSS